MPGLTATVADQTLSVIWDGDNGTELRLRFGIEAGTPTIQDLAVRRKGGAWATLATNVTPEFRVVSGRRRISEQQLGPLRTWGEAITPERAAREKWDTSFFKMTPEVLERGKWDPFWDDPLYVPGVEAGRPPRNPGLPRKPEEIKRATATYRADGCAVTTNGARLEVVFPGVQLGVFTGRLQYHRLQGHQPDSAGGDREDRGAVGRLQVRQRPCRPRDSARDQDRVARSREQPAGLPVRRLANKGPVPLQAANRVVVAEAAGGSIAAFPPPHVFFWAREAETNLGYTWYRKDSPSSFSFGIRQAEREDIEVYRGELRALQRAAGHVAADGRVPSTSARPGAADPPVGAGVHARRSLQAASRLSGDGEPLSLGIREPAAAAGRSRHQASRFGRHQGGGDQHPRRRRRRARPEWPRRSPPAGSTRWPPPTKPRGGTRTRTS